VVLGTTVTVQACLLVIATAVALVGAGCESVDPTEQFFDLNLRNNTSVVVVVRECSDERCTKFVSRDRLDPGGSVTRSISDRGVLMRYRVDRPSGATIGCLPVRLQQMYATAAVTVSETVTCPGASPVRAQVGKPLGHH
jgi:hypothetical protein